MEIDVFTLFPEWFEWFSTQRHVANALARGSRLSFLGYREHSTLSGAQVDDMPFGGGAGMVLRVDVVEAALRARYAVDPAELPRARRVIALTPGGRTLEDSVVDELAAEPALTLLCGRYEGFDERIVEHLCTDAISIGPYVLSNGDLPAMVLVDAIARRLPGALAEGSGELESFSAELGGGLEYPHYTRPADFEGWRVPDVLLSGNHANVERWRKEHVR